MVECWTLDRGNIVTNPLHIGAIDGDSLWRYDKTKSLYFAINRDFFIYLMLWSVSNNSLSLIQGSPTRRHQTLSSGCTLTSRCWSSRTDPDSLSLETTSSAPWVSESLVTFSALTHNNNDIKSIYIAPWFQVTLFKGAVTSKKNY